MFKKSSFYKVISTQIVVFFALMIPFHFVKACENATPPVVLLENLAAEIIAEVNTRREEIAHDPTVANRLIETILVPHIDKLTASRKVLGNYWSRMSDPQKKDFMRTFFIFLTRFSAEILADYLSEHKQNLDTTLIVFNKDYQTDGLDVTVRSVFHIQGGKTHSVNFTLRCKTSGWKVFDIEINGYSMVDQYQGCFKRKIDSSGFTSLLGFLRNRNKLMLAGNANQPEQEILQ